MPAVAPLAADLYHPGLDMRRSLTTRVILALGLFLSGVATAVCGERGGNSPVFRLGSAAKPFGWSTVIGDFNGDGTPDLAVADESSPAPGDYGYRIEFVISGRAPYDVRFESTQPAVTISLSDVDDDRDLDVLLCLPLSDKRVGVFLNDGRGHFTSADVRLFQVSRASGERARPPQRTDRERSCAVPPKRPGDALRPMCDSVARRAPARARVLRTNPPRWEGVPRQASPRGPPHSSK
jgi:FG-GAP repeat protein